MNFETLKHLSERKSLGEHVFENLKQAIIRGEVVPGTRLVESRIADALDISRTPVREAIHKLEREGLIEKLPRGGFSVLGLTREEIEETFGIRSVLESYAASLSALNYQKGELLPLEEKISEYEMYLQKKQLEILPKINTEFHDLLYTLSRSPKLNRMINHLRDQIYRFRQILLKDERMAQVSNADHRQMVALIRKKDAEGVEQLVREHILRGQAAVLKEFDEQSLAAS
ncbi:MAG TPA: GntR family transcriptional regulator [Desulfobacterales bacterium]|nr:GntR family transcriptional regulator [Desulfobacterales bacterium]